MRPEIQVARKFGDPMMEVKVTRDAEGNLNMESWIKDVSPGGIILGNKRPAMPIEMAHLCQMAALKIMEMALPGVRAGASTEGGADGQGAATEPKAN